MYDAIGRDAVIYRGPPNMIAVEFIDFSIDRTLDERPNLQIQRFPGVIAHKFAKPSNGSWG